MRKLLGNYNLYDVKPTFLITLNGPMNLGVNFLVRYAGSYKFLVSSIT